MIPWAYRSSAQHVGYEESALTACWGILYRICVVSPYPGPTQKQPTTHRDRSSDRGRLPIFHVTLLGKLRLRRGLQWYHTLTDIPNILQITAKSRCHRLGLVVALWRRWPEAARCLLRRLLRAPRVCYAGPAMASSERLPVPDVELSRPALVLAQRFVQRWDLYARQLDDGSYVCVHEQLNVGHLFAHLRGEITLGTYLLSQESQVRFIVLDADDAQAWERLGHLAGVLADEDVPSYLERSRRGGHLWLFLAQAIAGRDARAFGQRLLAAHQIEGVELYPKQDQLADGPGSLIRMPFGVHRLADRRYGFYTANEISLAPSIREQIYALKTPEIVPAAAFEAYRSFVPPQPAAVVTESPEELTGTLSERIKASVMVLEIESC